MQVEHVPNSRSPRNRTPKVNIRRGMVRLWTLLTVVWLATVGGIWLSIYWDGLLQAGSELTTRWTMTLSDLIAPYDYDALCAKLRAQRAAGGPVDQIPRVPVIDIVVKNKRAKVV